MTDLRVVDVDDPFLRDQLLDALTASPGRGVLVAGVVKVVADDVADAVLAVIRERRPVSMRTERAVGATLRAIMDPGRSPDHHRRVMARHRAEWPGLWRALDQLTEKRTSDGH